MKDFVRKSFLLGLGAASMSKAKAEKIVKELVKRNALTIKQGKEMLKKVKKEAANEKKRIQKFAEQEANRLTGKLSSASKIQVIKAKKRLKSINKELSSKGRSTLIKIIKEISKP